MICRWTRPARAMDDGYEVTIEVTAKQFAADGNGKETEEPLDSWFDVAVFADTDKPLEEAMPLYIAKHRLRSGKQVLTVRTTQKPEIVALDPFHKMIERSAGNNRFTCKHSLHKNPNLHKKPGAQKTSSLPLTLYPPTGCMISPDERRRPTANTRRAC